MEDHGPLLLLEAFQVGPAVLLVHGQKALEGEPGGGQARDRQGVHKGAGPRNGHHRDILGGTLGHQLLAGVADGRGAGVGDQGAALPGQQTGDQLIPPGVGIVAVIAHHGLLDVQVVQELHRHPGVLCGDEIHRPQGVSRPKGHVAQVPDGGGDQI